MSPEIVATTCCNDRTVCSLHAAAARMREALDILTRACEARASVGPDSPAVTQARALLKEIEPWKAEGAYRCTGANYHDSACGGVCGILPAPQAHKEGA